jgi:hypothetical protein
VGVFVGRLVWSGRNSACPASDEAGLAQVTHLGINFGVFGWLVERKSLSDKGRSSQMPCSEDLGLEFSLVES